MFVKLSRDVGRRSYLEPMMKYVGNMHGNEVISRQVLIYLAEYLAAHYGSEPRVTRLLNNTEIFLLPSLNPDGYESSVEGACDNNRRGRNNANNVDLNRNFPRQFDEPQGDLRRLMAGRERHRWRNSPLEYRRRRALNMVHAAQWRRDATSPMCAP